MNQGPEFVLINWTFFGDDVMARQRDIVTYSWSTAALYAKQD